MKANVAVLVSGGGTNLQAIIDAEKNGIIKNASVKLVISNKTGAYALERAEKAGIKTCTVLCDVLGGQSAFENEIIRLLELYNIDIIVLAGFMSILTEYFTSKYPNRILNVHPSLIPKFCGKGFYGIKVHQKVLEAGEKITGATVHFVNEIPDGGAIIFQKEVPIVDGDTPESLQLRVMKEAEWKLLPMAIEKVAKDLSKK